ncbi:MAG: hypothetical protein FJ194_02225 [Gammaproteobacteria bacterium]|nr:hypothetical protein [Gammaproteobacteria bacterium]
MPPQPDSAPHNRPVYLILGRGGQGHDVLDALLAAGRKVAGVFDDDTPPLPSDVPILGALADWTRWVKPGTELMPGMGDPAERSRIAADIAALGGRLASAIHPRAVVSPRTTRQGRVHRRRLRDRTGRGPWRPHIPERQLRNRP